MVNWPKLWNPPIPLNVIDLGLLQWIYQNFSTTKGWNMPWKQLGLAHPHLGQFTRFFCKGLPLISNTPSRRWSAGSSSSCPSSGWRPPPSCWPARWRTRWAGRWRCTRWIAAGSPPLSRPGARRRRVLIQLLRRWKVFVEERQYQTPSFLSAQLTPTPAVP